MKINKFLFIIFFTLFLMVTFLINIKAEEGNGLSGDVGSIIIPVEKKWQDVATADRPSSVTVKLYKYLGTLNTSANPIRTMVLTSENDWKGNFDISNETLVSGNQNYSFAIVEEEVSGFQEVLADHVNPNVTFIAPSTSSDWHVTNPCSELNITVNADYKTVLVVKKGGDFIVWTAEALTENERELICNSVKKNNEFKKISSDSATFISGFGGTSNGITVTEDKITFAASSKWAKFATGLYYKSSVETNSSSITNTHKKKTLSVEKKWIDHNNILGLRPTSVSVQLYNFETPIGDPIILNESNEWKYDYTDLNEYINGALASYSIREIYDGIYTSTSDVSGNKTTITNKYEVTPTTVSVTKFWVNTEHYIENLPGVIVNLCYRTDENDNDCKVIASAILNDDNDWSYTFTQGQDGEKELDILPSNYIYEVSEVGYDGLQEEDRYFFENFIVTSIDHDNNNWSITNTCIASYELPEAGSSGMLILIVIGSLLLVSPVIYIGYNFYKRKMIS